MGMEHNRPDGLYRGYYCGVCGAPGLSMMGNNEHGPGKCKPNPGLLRILKYLNSKNATTGVMQGLCQHDWRTDLRKIDEPGKIWYFCARCGLPEVNLGAKRSAEIAKEKEMAKFDQGGGCPCGLYRECECDMSEVRKPVTSQAGTVTPRPGEPTMVWDLRDTLTAAGTVKGAPNDHMTQVGRGWNPDVTKTGEPEDRAPTWGPKVGDGLSLGDKLAATIAALEGAKIMRLEEQAAADIAKIERERADIAHFVETLKNSMVDAIEAGRVPLVKVDNYERKKWVEAAVKGNAPHQLYWKKMRDWFGQEALVLTVTSAHDGVGMNDWLNVTVTPSGVGKVNYRDGK